MRVLSQPVFTYSVGLVAGLQQQNTKLVPFFGPVAGFWLDLTVTLAGATASKTWVWLPARLRTSLVDPTAMNLPPDTANASARGIAGSMV